MDHLPLPERRISPLIASAAAFLVILPAIVNAHVFEYDEAIFMNVARNIQRLGAAPALDHC